MEEVQKRGDVKPSFDYEQVDEKMAEFLRKKESNMRGVISKAYTDLGRELYEAQQELVGSRYDGVFVKWYRYLGYADRTVYNLIDRFTELQKLQNGDLQERFEKLPVTLSYEISGKSSESTEPKRQAKQAVLNGEVKTLKEYHELEEKLHKEEEARQTAERKLGLAEHEADILRDTLESFHFSVIQAPY